MWLAANMLRLQPDFAANYTIIVLDPRIKLNYYKKQEWKEKYIDAAVKIIKDTYKMITKIFLPPLVSILVIPPLLMKTIIFQTYLELMNLIIMKKRKNLKIISKNL